MTVAKKPGSCQQCFRLAHLTQELGHWAPFPTPAAPFPWEKWVPRERRELGPAGWQPCICRA